MPSGTAHTILVVDDAPVNLKLMRLLLTHEGYDVRAAERAEDALQMLGSFRPELVLADIRMPGMDGLELTRRIKADPNTSNLRVVALTACAMESEREEAMRAGCEDFISKPIDSKALAVRIRELLARAPHNRTEASEPVPACGSFGLSGPEMEGLRRRFVNAGVAACRQLLETLDRAFDPVQAGMTLHQWAGSASLLGFPEISRSAAEAEQLLRDGQTGSPAFLTALASLDDAFLAAHSGAAVPLPAHLVQSLSGKRIALIGLDVSQADRMCALLDRVDGRVLLFDASESPASPAVAASALVVIQVREEVVAGPWFEDEHPSLSGKLVLTGSRRDLLALPPAVRLRAAEFLVDDWDPEEALIRFASVLQRSAAPPPPVTARVSQPVAAPVAPRRPATVTRPIVVVADDDSFILALVSSTLENYGMTCRPAGNGRDALQLIREEKPHIAVLDVNMPELDGFEVLAAVRAEGLPTMVVLLTARQQEKEVVRGFELGADDYLTKPFNPFELAARLKRLIRR